MRGGFVSLAERCEELAAGGFRPDVVLASDMLDLAGFRGLLPAAWVEVPAALYFHESQLTYPDSPRMESDLSYAFTNWTSALTADRVIFNSRFHRDVFFQELPRLLRHFPDHTHEHLVEAVRARSTVVPVGVDLSWAVAGPRPDDPPLVVWNHRWEHDKDPETFLDAIESIARREHDLRVALCGESFGNGSERFAEAGRRLGRRVVQFGFAPVDRYREILNTADVVVSTSRQEFFGISIVEAMAAGASPVLPSRLSYPELVPAEVHDDVLYREGELESALERMIIDVERRARVTEVTVPAARRFDWSEVGPMLDAEIASMRPQGKPRIWRDTADPAH